MEAFYVVWCPQSGAPTFRHETKQLALLEAQRLAIQNPGKDFFVLEALTLTKRNDLVTIELSPPLPF